MPLTSDIIIVLYKAITANMFADSCLFILPADPEQQQNYRTMPDYYHLGLILKMLAFILIWNNRIVLSELIAEIWE